MDGCNLRNTEETQSKGADVRRAARTDANQKEIVTKLRKRGYSVWPDCAKLGRGFPDLLVAKDGLSTLVEIKTGNGKLTPDQCRFIENWKAPVVIALCAEDVEYHYREAKEDFK